jgi:hypothetical protein
MTLTEEEAEVKISKMKEVLGSSWSALKYKKGADPNKVYSIEMSNGIHEVVWNVEDQTYVASYYGCEIYVQTDPIRDLEDVVNEIRGLYERILKKEFDAKIKLFDSKFEGMNEEV